MYPSQNVYAQFTNPTLPDQSYSAGTVAGRNTGCDILEYSGDVYRVSVWEPTGTTQSFGWVVNLGATQYVGTLPFTATGAIGDPDVCLLIKPITNTIFAAVVYYDITNAEWDLEFYEWDLPSTQFIPTTSFFQLATGPFGTSINIDGNDHPDSEFAIVWDDVNGDIHTTVGDMGSLVLYNDLTLIDGIQPDVSLFYDGNNDIAHLTYINPNGRLVVLDYDFPTLASGSTGTPFTALLEWPTQTGGVYSYPRIASPIGSSGTTSEWTVVVEELDTSPFNSLIVGYNNGVPAPIFYNDGTAPSPANLTAVHNYYVSVCYDSNYPNFNGIWVGWQFDDTGANYSYTNQIQKSEYSVVLQCDVTAIPTGSLDYLQVPFSITTVANDLSGFLSLAGRFVTDELFLTYQNVIINGSSVDDINYKIITGASGISALRGVLNNDGNISFDQLNDEAQIEMKILGMEGRLLFKKQVSKQDVKNNLAEFSRCFSSSMYLVSLRSIEMDSSYCYKAILGQ